MGTDVVVVDPDDVAVAHRASGSLVGAAVGDALGAPFEFGPPGAYRSRFPHAVLGGTGELVGGGPFGWAPGQFTDDTEMAVATAESLLARGGIDPDDLLARYRAWAAAANDVGNLTRAVLDSGRPAAEAAQAVYAGRGGRGTAGNGSIMRATPGAVRFAPAGREATMAAGRALSAVTHADPLAQWGVALQHELVRLALAGADPLAHLAELVAGLPVDVRATYEPLLAPGWTPEHPAPPNGSAMGALAQAVWAVRTFPTFEEAVTAVVDLGGDTDSAAAVTGALAGAVHGLGAIPSRWVTYVHGVVHGPGGARRYDHLDLQGLARRLLGGDVVPERDDGPPLGPAEVDPGVHAANRAGARTVGDEFAVVSLCRIDDTMRRPVRREVFMVDRDGHNPALGDVLDDTIAAIAAFRAEGRPVLVHCHGGQSRTAFVLTAWLMHQGMGRAEAQAHLRGRWPHAVEWTADFADLLTERGRRP